MKGILRIEGPCSINGSLKISGSKFTSIPIIVGSLLSQKKVHLRNVPKIKDIEVLISSLHFLDVGITIKQNSLFIDASSFNNQDIPDYLAKQMRGVFLFLPALLVIRGRASIAIPGGCRIGKRPFDEHIRVLKKFGVEVMFVDGRFVARVDKIKRAEVSLRGLYPSPGATKTFLIMALGATGESVINNASVLPEVIEFISFLKELGAKIEIKGTTIVVKKSDLHGGKFDIPPDRIECLTWIAAAAITKGKIEINNGASSLHKCKKEFSVLSEMGINITRNNNTLFVDGDVELRSADITTGAYPQFNTDAQPIFTPLLIASKGVSRLTENIFEDRFKHLYELQKMGAEFVFKGERTVLVEPIPELKGTVVCGHDIRGTVSLALAAFKARGVTTILGAGHLERAYENFEGKASFLGANIKRIVE